MVKTVNIGRSKGRHLSKHTTNSKELSMTKEETSDRMLAWFNDLAKRAEAVLYKPIEPLTEHERKMLGIIHESV
jgi:hypothetical protein